MSTQTITTKPRISADQFTRMQTMITETRRAIDAFANPAARLGVGSNNLLEFTQYPLTRLSFNYILLQSLYRSNWVVRKVVDSVAEDMTKNWVRVDTELPPAKIDGFNRSVDATGTRNQLQTTMKWARLFGGAAAVMIIEGQEDELEKPLDLDDVELGSYRGLIPLDRWSGIYPSGELSNDLSRPLDFGLPAYYEVYPNQGAAFKVHNTRVLRFIGNDLPVWEKQVEMYWGTSVVEPMYDELKKFDNTSWNIASLIFRANIIALRQKGLAQFLSGLGANEQAQKNFYSALQAQSQLLSNQGMMILDQEGGLETHQFSFGGLRDMYESFKENICGATGIPYSRLFGRPPGGLATTNEGDEHVYYENMASRQNRELQPQMLKLMPVIAMSAWGKVPKDFSWSYNPVRALTNETRSQLAKEKTESVIEVYNTGLISDRTALLELKQQSEETGAWTNITDDDIAAASNKPVKQEQMEMGLPGAGDEEGGGKEAMDADFKESEHPRGAAGTSKGGQFVSKGGGGGSPSGGGSSDIPATLAKGAHKTAGSFAMAMIKEGKHSDFEIAEATKAHFGTKTDLKSIAWYKNKMKQDTPEWKAKQAAKKAAQAANNDKITEAGKKPMNAEQLNYQHVQQQSKQPFFVKLYSSTKGYHYVKIKNGPMDSSQYVTAAISNIVQAKNPGSSIQFVKPFSTAYPAPKEGFQDFELSDFQLKEIDSQAHQLAAKKAAEQAAQAAKAAEEAKQKAEKQKLTAKSYATTKMSVPLTAPQQKSLEGYTDGEYKSLNYNLRSGKPLSSYQAQLAFNIDAAMKNSRFPEDTFVYRGVGNAEAFFGPQVTKGTIVIDNGFISTSKHYSTGFADSKNLVARINVKKGSRGIDVSSFSLHPLEDEIILPRGSMFIVKSVTDNIVEVDYVDNN